MSFFNPEASLVIYRGKLPHWRQEGAIYFVTFHLADSLPQTKLEWLRREKELWLRLNPEPHTDEQKRQYHERFTQTVDRWLDAGYGRCILARSDCKVIMEASLLHFDGVRYDLGELCSDAKPCTRYRSSDRRTSIEPNTSYLEIVHHASVQSCPDFARTHLAPGKLRPHRP